MKKMLICLITLSLVLSFFSIPALAAEPAPAESQSTVDPRTSTNVWYTRVYNGKLQKRLWSNTYGVWLTDWIDVE